MNTPITDAAMVRVLDTQATRMAGSQVEGVFKLYVCPLVARRLELDRAIFRQALIDIYLSPAADSRGLANAALQAASKFEGEEYTP